MLISVMNAWAQDIGGSQTAPPAGGGLFSLLPFILIFVIFYFLLIRPQQKQKKQHKEMLDAIKKGDRVITSSGFMGTVANIHKDVVTLQIGDNVKLKMKKDHIAMLQTEEDKG